MSNNALLWCVQGDEDSIPLHIMLLLMDEVFDLKNRNQWLRRRIVAILQQIAKTMFGDSINRWVELRVAVCVTEIIPISRFLWVLFPPCDAKFGTEMMLLGLFWTSIWGVIVGDLGPQRWFLSALWAAVSTTWTVRQWRHTVHGLLQLSPGLNTADRHWWVVTTHLVIGRSHEYSLS